MAERPTQPRGAGYYQRSKAEEFPPKASETIAMDKGKTQLEELKEKEEWAQKQLENTTESSRNVYRRCQELEAEKRQLSEEMNELSRLNDENVALVNELKAQVRKLEQEKETLQNEVQIAKTEAQLYMEDFESERSDREVAHGKIADHQRKYAEDVGKLKAQLAQMEEHLSHHQDRLSEVEQVSQRREKEMISLLKEASKNQQEVQAKTSQVKQYKKQVDSLKDQVAVFQKHNEDLIQELDRVMTEMEKKQRTFKPKNKPADADDTPKLVELEARNKELEGRTRELLKERDKLFKELEKTKKELVQVKPNKDAEKGKKEATKKQCDKGATAPEPSEMSKALEGNTAEEEQLYAQLLNQNDILREELEHYRKAYKELHTLFKPGAENLLLARSRESSHSPLTSPVVDLPRASDPGQPPPRILEEDEEIEQEKIKQTLDMQFQKQRQPFQSVEDQSATVGAGIPPVPKANASPVQYARNEEAVALRLQLEAQKSEQDQLHHQLEQTEATVRQLEADLNFSRARVAELEREITKLEELITEKEALQQATQAEQLKLSQLTQEKDQFIQNLQSEKDQLRQQLAALSWQIQRYAQQPQSQRPHESNFWEVPRSEITLNMQKFLGTGAWGFVVEGIFRGQRVAVKCLHDLIRQPEVIEVIRKEIGIMAQIRHPNLVLLIAAVIDAKKDPLIVTELLDTSLRKAYEEDLLKGSSKLSIFRDIASALNYLHLHQRGEIIHRDVSSANILLEAKPNNQWKAKLSDFGSAKLAIEAKTTGPGAPAYTAPEVRKEMGIRQTAKLDVYSYGIVLCEVIVGQFPMEGSLPSMMQVVRNRWPFMHDLVTSCIQEHPDNRPTMSYVLERFDKLRPQK